MQSCIHRWMFHTSKHCIMHAACSHSQGCTPVSPAKEQCLCAALCRPPDVTHPTDQLLYGLQIQTCRAQGSYSSTIFNNTLWLTKSNAPALMCCSLDSQITGCMTAHSMKPCLPNQQQIRARSRKKQACRGGAAARHQKHGQACQASSSSSYSHKADESTKKVGQAPFCSKQHLATAVTSGQPGQGFIGNPGSGIHLSTPATSSPPAHQIWPP